MTEPLEDHRKLSARASGKPAEVAATTSGAPQGTPVPAISGLAVRRADGAAVIRRDFDFVGKGILSEPFNFDADVAEAIERSKSFRVSIAKAKEAINALTVPSVRSTGLAELKRIEKFVDTWEGKKVPLDKRKEVVDEVATTTLRLEKIADEYAEQDAAEVQRIKQQERKQKKEQERQKKAELKAKEEEAALAREAQRKELAAAEANAANRSRLDERGVLPASQKVATAKAKAETDDEEKALRAEHAREQKFGTKTSKAKATETLNAGLARLEKQRTESENRSFGVLANFASTAAGRKLEKDDLAWVIETAGVDSARARSLAEVINASGKDRTVVRELAGLKGTEFTSTAQHCITLFGKGVDASLVLTGARAMTNSPEVKAYLTSAGVKLIPGYLALVDVEAPQELKEALAYDLQTVGTAYTPKVARRLAIGLAEKNPERQAVYWLTELKAAPEFAALVDLAVDPAVELDALRKVFRAAAKVYDAAETLGLCQRHKTELADLEARVADGQPGCPAATDLLMANRKLARVNEMHQLAALRAVALLEAKSNEVTLSIAKDPKDFGRGPDNVHREANIENDAKTGFVQMAVKHLPGYFEIHTHWGQKQDGKIYSMHVEYDGRNGIELGTAEVFGPLIDKVVALHNDRYPKPDGGDFHV